MDESTKQPHPDPELAAIFRKAKWDIVQCMILLFIAQTEVNVLAFLICFSYLPH